MKSTVLSNLRVSEEIATALKHRARELGITQSELHRRILSDALLRPAPPPIIPIVGTVDKEGKVIYFRQKEAA